MNTYKKCYRIASRILTAASETYVYDWGSEFNNDHIQDAFSKTVKELEEDEDLNKIDPTNLTEEQMKTLGFKKFTENSSRYLIPLWLYPFLEEKIETIAIDGKETKKKSEIDTDNRFGCLAYSVIPKK